MDILYLFLKIFGLLILMFALVMIFFIYPTNILYHNEEYKPKGEPDVLFVWGIIIVCLVDSLLYYYYNFGTSYLCTISKYWVCSSRISHLAVHVLLLLHLAVSVAFSYLFTNRLVEYIKSKKLDAYLFSFATASIILVLINYNIYDNLFLNRNILYFNVRIMLYIVTFSPIYSYLLVNLFLKRRPKKKKKNKKTTSSNTKQNTNNKNS